MPGFSPCRSCFSWPQLRWCFHRNHIQLGHIDCPSEIHVGSIRSSCHMCFHHRPMLQRLGEFCCHTSMAGLLQIREHPEWDQLGLACEMNARSCVAGSGGLWWSLSPWTSAFKPIPLSVLAKLQNVRSWWPQAACTYLTRSFLFAHSHRKVNSNF
jgi:hypothetical protein